MEIYRRQDGVAFCRVEVGQLMRTDVPITATNRGFAAPSPDSLLSYQSVQQLLRTFQGIMEVRDDATATTANQDQNSQTDYAQKSLVILDGQTTTAICTDNRGGLPTTSQSASDATGEA